MIARERRGKGTVIRAAVWWFIGAWLVTLGATHLFAQVCGCDISAEKVAAYDRLLLLDPYTRAGALASHFPWGVPVNSPHADNEVLLVQQHYVVNYDKDLRVPVWARYRLTADDLSTDRTRLECFRRDTRIAPADSALCGDYDEPPGVEPRYDQGHLVPNSDMERSEAAMINTYMFTNMTPQHDTFNRFNGGLWFHLEDRVRTWAKARGVIYIIAGAIFDHTGPAGAPDGRRDADADAVRLVTAAGAARVAIPTHFYKIVVHPRLDGSIESLAFLLKHEDRRFPAPARDPALVESLTTIAAIESMTGVTFLPQLMLQEPERAAAVKTFQATALWMGE